MMICLPANNTSSISFFATTALFLVLLLAFLISWYLRVEHIKKLKTILFCNSLLYVQ